LYVPIKIVKGSGIMSSLVSKVSYLNGLMAGLGLDDESKEGKLITQIVEILKEMAEEIENVKDNQDELEDYVNSIDEDLSNMENDYYDIDDEEDEDEEDYEDTDDEYAELQCSKCNETVYVDKGILKDKEAIICPNCHNKIELKKECSHDCNCED
jgi:DNA-directed RNA polymerase subunit delta